LGGLNASGLSYATRVTAPAQASRFLLSLFQGFQTNPQSQDHSDFRRSGIESDTQDVA
ncbi:hypothetical protein THAOC_33841, partial [Thalassiosira oceanica]